MFQASLGLRGCWLLVVRLRMAVAWPLILVIIAMMAGIVVACTYMLAHFHHPDDANTAYFPKVIVVLGLSFAGFSVLMLPLDVANRNSGSTLDMLLLVYIVYPCVLGLALLAIPFAIFYYEAEQPENNKTRKQLSSAACYTFWMFFVFALLAGILYAFLGKAEIPVQALTAKLGPPGAPISAPCVGCTKKEVSLDIHVSLLVYLIAMLAFLGLLLMVCFGGVGMVALPLELIMDYVERPKRLAPDVLAHRKAQLGVQAARLIEEGEAISRKDRERGGVKRKRKDRKAYAAFQKKVYLLEKDFKKNVAAHASNKHPWWYLWYLFLGIMTAFLALFWVIHIILYMMIDPPASPFLNDMFIDLDKAFPLFGTLAYASFSFFLLWAVVKGNIKVGLRVPFLVIFPLEKHNSLMNALLFNTALILISSLAVTQFCATAFFDYARLTAVGSVFSVQLGHLKATRWLVANAEYVLVVIVFLSFIWLVCLCPPNRKKKNAYDDDD